MTDKERLRMNYETAASAMYGTGLTVEQASAAIRKFINTLPTVTQVMKNFALEARKKNDR